MGFVFSEGVGIKLDYVVGTWWCVFEPTTSVQTPRTEDEGQRKKHQGIVVDWTRERWARRYNSVWSKIIAAWAPLIAGNDGTPIRACGIEGFEGLDAEFLILLRQRGVERHMIMNIFGGTKGER